MATGSDYDSDAMFVSILGFWMASVVLLIATIALFMLNYCQKERRVSVIRYDASKDASHSKQQPYPYQTGNGAGPEMIESPDSPMPDYNFSFPDAGNNGQLQQQPGGHLDGPDVNDNSQSDSKATNF